MIKLMVSLMFVVLLAGCSYESKYYYRCDSTAKNMMKESFDNCVSGGYHPNSCQRTLKRMYCDIVFRKNV